MTLSAATVACARGCYDMWTGTETDNIPAQKTYARAGARTTPAQLILEWDFEESRQG